MKFDTTSRILPLYQALIFSVFCLFIFCLPFSKAIVEISIVLTLVFWFLAALHAWLLESPEARQPFCRYFAFPNLPVNNVVLVFLLAVIVSAVLSAASGMETKLVVRGFFKHAKWFVLFYAGVLIFQDQKWLSPMMKVMAVALGLMIYDALLQALFGYDVLRLKAISRAFPIPRVRACFDSENAFAAYLILVMPPVFAALSQWNSRLFSGRKKAWAIAGGVFFLLAAMFCFVQTRTRSGWLGVVAGGMALFTFIRKRYILALLALMSAIFLVPSALNMINEKMALREPSRYTVPRDEVIFQYSSEDIQERLILWKQAWGFFKQRPYTGIGPNTYNVMIKKYPIPHPIVGQEPTPYAHNSYLQLMAELGLIGTLPLIAVLAWTVWIVWKTLKFLNPKDFSGRVLAGLFAGCVGFLVKAAFDTEFHSLQRVNLFWFLAGMSVGIVFSLRKDQGNTLEAQRSGKLKMIHAANYQSLQNLILPHMKHQTGKGHEVMGLTSAQAPYEQMDGIPIKKIEFEAQAFQPLKEPFDFLRLMTVIYREAPDVVHTHNVKFGVFGRLAARAAGVPHVVHTAHGIYRTFGKKDFKNKMIDLLEKICNRCCEAVFFVSPFDYEQYLKDRVVSAPQAVLIGNGVDQERFDASRLTLKDKQQKREELGINSGAKVVGMVGRLVRDKGFEEFFEAAGKLAQRYPDIRFVIIASKYQREDNVPEKIADQFKIKDKTLFLYDREDMPALYSIMDLLVHPSWREGLPRVLMEAASMGIPCVVTDIPGNRNVIRDESFGCLVPVRNAEALYEACVWTLEHPEETAARALKAQNYAGENFDDRVMIRKLDEGYQKVIPEYRDQKSAELCTAYAKS